MSYTRKTQMATQLQALKITVVPAKSQPTRVDLGDVLDWSTDRPRARRGTVVQGLVVQTMKDRISRRSTRAGIFR
jgi:hypothetical protein